METVKEKLIDEIAGLDWYHVNERTGKLVAGSNSYNVSYWRCDEVEAAIEKVFNGATLQDATDTNVGGKSGPSDEWVSVDERLPKESDSMFAKYYGTEKWGNAMFRKCSGDVIVCIEYEDGSRRTGVARTLDGKWNLKGVWKMKVTHWMPLPAPPKGDNSNE